MMKKQELLFAIIGILLLLITIWFAVYSINFLMKNISRAMDQSSIKAQETAKFDLEELKKLGIME